MFSILDCLTLFCYFAALLGVAWYVLRQKTDSAKDYFLGGKNATWLIIGTSLFASNIGSEHLVGLAGAGASDGMMMAHYELHAWILLVLGWVMVPFYERSSIYTMPEFLEKRYCPAARWFLSVMSLIAYILTKISVTLFAGGIVFKALFPAQFISGIDNFWVGAVGMVLITGIYTVLGGLRAVLYTELFQTAVLIIGSSCVLVFGVQQVGGWAKLKEITQGADRVFAEEVVDNAGNKTIVKYKKFTDGSRLPADGSIENRPIESKPVENKLTESKTLVKTDFFNLWRSMFDPSFPWLGLLFGAPIVGLWYWCTDQYIVQRTLAARSQTEARRGTIFAAYLKMFPVFIFIVPGMTAYALAVQGKIGPEVLMEPNQAFPVLVREVLPAGLKGIVVGGLLAALMSSLASVFNSCSTLFTMDIYKKLHRNASEKHLVRVGRMATACMVVLGIAWIPFIQNMPGTLYGYLQSVQSYVAPPIFAVFFLGVFFKRVNSYGCMAGLLTGFVLGMLRLALEIKYGKAMDDEAWSAGIFNSVLYWFITLNFAYMCAVLAAVCMLVIAAVSLLTPKQQESQLAGLTYSTVSSEQRLATRRGWGWLDVSLSVGIVAVILVIYIYFTG